MTEQAPPTRDLSWLLDDLGERVEHIEQAVILSRDGLLLAASSNLGRESSEHLCALASGLQGLAKGVGEYFEAGEVRQTIVELQRAFLFVTAAGEGSCLAVLCSSRADAGLIAYEMAMLVKRAAPHLSAFPRQSEAFDQADALSDLAGAEDPGEPGTVSTRGIAP